MGDPSEAEIIERFRDLAQGYCLSQSGLPWDECRRRVSLVKEISGHPEIVDNWTIQWWTGKEWIDVISTAESSPVAPRSVGELLDKFGELRRGPK